MLVSVSTTNSSLRTIYRQSSVTCEFSETPHQTVAYESHEKNLPILLLIGLRPFLYYLDANQAALPSLFPIQIVGGSSYL